MSRIEKISDHTSVLRLNDGRAFALSNRVDNSLDSVFWMAQQRNWEQLPQTVCGQKIVPFGHDNNLPVHLRDILDENNLGPGILERQMGLLYGQGVFLNRLAYQEGNIVHRWEEDREIQAWLDSWDYVSYIKGCMTDYLHLKGFFDAKYLEKGRRIGRSHGSPILSIFHPRTQGWSGRTAGRSRMSGTSSWGTSSIPASVPA